MHYKKPALSFEAQINQLEERGLRIEGRERALRWLSRVSYYRLSAYFLPFKVGGIENRFKDGTTFTMICELYNFDRKLRLLMLDAIERIEVALRTSITYEIAHRHGPFGHTDPRNFSGLLDHNKFMGELREAERGSRETFVQHFRRKYTKEEHLPIWMASELLSLGWMSRLYGALSPDAKRGIAAPYGTPDPILASWLHTVSVVRNICAHHARLWNRELGVQPKIPPAPNSYWPFLRPTATGRLYATLLITHILLTGIAPRSEWSRRVAALLRAYPNVDFAAMGMPAGALEAPPWAEQTAPHRPHSL